MERLKEEKKKKRKRPTKEQTMEKAMDSVITDISKMQEDSDARFSELKEKRLRLEEKIIELEERWRESQERQQKEDREFRLQMMQLLARQQSCPPFYYNPSLAGSGLGSDTGGSMYGWPEEPET